MTVLDLRLFGDPVLRTVADHIDDPMEPSLRILVADMLETMDAAGGVGLAANQVGVTRRIFVYDCEGDRGHIINPTWEAVGEETNIDHEGCLSVPDVGGDVMRATTVRVSGEMIDGGSVSREVTGLLARCVQHETDHLNGVMFFQRMAPEGRREVMAEIRASEWFNR